MFKCKKGNQLKRQSIKIGCVLLIFLVGGGFLFHRGQQQGRHSTVETLVSTSEETVSVNSSEERMIIEEPSNQVTVYVNESAAVN